MADEAIHVGLAPARQSYLEQDRIIAAARRTGADAIHPGYGFLSENAGFAEACVAADLVFIGPPAAAIRAMGSKSAAKALMETSGVPLVPGYHGAAQDFATLEAAANAVGYPVLIKASAGGGGKGMRIVERPEGLVAAIESAKRESFSSFGDERLLIERYLTRPRHIEIQIFADAQGNCISLFERDCSIQRRYQKIIEEAPAPGMEASMRDAMGQAAIKAARAVGYVGAGTVEFIVENGGFYFMEMNTRLQVEHPVTEMITGLDLVEWQLRIGSGEPLPLKQEDIRMHGCAIEARIYAEDPSRDFLPSIGKLAHLRQPNDSIHVRVESGVVEGDEISPNYDPMIAKLIVLGDDRPDAVRQLRDALAQYEVAGVRTNLELLGAIAAHPAYAAGDLDTGFIGRYGTELFPREIPGPDRWTLAAFAARRIADLRREREHEAAMSEDRWSPWAVFDSWRMNARGSTTFILEYDGERFSVAVHSIADDAFVLRTPEGEFQVWASIDGTRMRLRLDGEVRGLSAVSFGHDIAIFDRGQSQILRVVDPLAPSHSDAAGSDRVTVPIPSRVTRVLVAAGDAVKKGAPLLVLEAMKMELTLSAPFDGTVESVRCRIDEMVVEGAELVTFAVPAA